MGGSIAAKKRRVRRVLELSVAGMTIPEISTLMLKEGHAASERTVWADQNSIEAQEYLEEIMRKQLTDITIADIDLRLKYRGKLLDNLIPQKVLQKVEQETKVEVSVPELNIEGLLADFGEPIVSEILRRRLGPDRQVPRQDPEESLDTSHADPETA